MPTAKSLSNADRLVRSTGKIEAMKNGNVTGSGSGLLMAIYPYSAPNDSFITAIVTNKHVVNGADFVSIGLPLQIPGSAATNIAPAKSFVLHPDPNIDLCVIPISPEVMKHSSLSEFISSRDIFTDDKLTDLTAIEQILMIGYPNGLVDQNHLYPISRQGITATPAFATLNGRPDFMIDCACFPGSSGSPVFVFDRMGHVDKSNNVHLGTSRFGLIGFLHAGPVMNAAGTLIPSTPPTALGQMVNVPLMMNLGICVRASKVLDMIPEMLKVAAR